MTNITYADDKIEIIKSVINSDSVSLEQIGMVALLLFGEFETVNTRSIINSVSNGQTTVTKSMKALESMNVLYKHRGKINGRFSAYEYVLSKANNISSRSPCVAKQHMVAPNVEKSYVESSYTESQYADNTYSYNNIYNNNISSYDDISIISYPYRDSNDRNDVIEDNDINNDLFLESLSNPITHSGDIVSSGDIVPYSSQINGTKSQIDVKSQICYDILANEFSDDIDLIDMIVNVMSESYTSVAPCTRIGGKFVATRNVVTWLMKLEKSDIAYVIDCIKNNSRKIRTIKPYLLTSLYNAAVNQDNRKIAEKYSDGKSKKKIELRNDDDCHSTINWDLYDKMVEEQTKMIEKLGAGEITVDELFF